jgi:hypothetical protein
MSVQINFFAAEGDDRALCGRARELGLWIIPTNWKRDEPWPKEFGPSEKRVCGLSIVAPDNLHPVEVLPKGSGWLRAGWATDPVLEFDRSVVSGTDIVAGRIWWSDYPPDFARRTKPPFASLRKWIRAHWKRRGDGFYVGPEAERLIAQGYEALYLPRGTVVETVKV